MRGTKRGLTGAASTCVLVLLSTLSGFTSSDSRYEGPRPTSSTSPDKFARIYLTAAQDGDCGFVREYTNSHNVPDGQFCSDPRIRHFRDVIRPQFVPASEAGVDEEDVSFEMDTDGSSDGTIPSGWYGWGIALVRTKAGWRVTDDGVG